MVGSAQRTEVWPRFLELWERLLRASGEPGTVILVEGVRDRRSLRALHVPGPIHLLHRGQRISDVAEGLSRDVRRVIVLTDWDTEGGHFARRLRDFLAPAPVALDLEFRRELARVLRGEVSHVEGLAGWARRTADRVGAPLDHFLGEIERAERAPTG